MDYIQIRELYHHGIKGMKWGLRRFQNIDGSLTPAGEKRYGISDQSDKKATQDTLSKNKRYQKDLAKYEKHYQKLDSKFKDNVYNTERKIALANYNNLSQGRKHIDDDSISRAIRYDAIDSRKKGEKILTELFESGYYQKKYGFDPKETSYETFMSAVEKQAVKEYVTKYGGLKVSAFDNEEEAYERAIVEYTSKR